MTSTPSPEQADGGFDPTKPFRTRDGREVNVRKKEEQGRWHWRGYIAGQDQEISWWPTGRYVGGQTHKNDLVNIAPSPSDPAPAESDAAFVERVEKAGKLLEEDSELHRLAALARRGLRAPETSQPSPTDTDAAYLARQARDTGIVGPGGPLRRMYLLALAYIEGRQAGQPVNEWGSIEEYVADYVLETDTPYTPNDHERFLLTDAITGYVEGFKTTPRQAEMVAWQWRWAYLLSAGPWTGSFATEAEAAHAARTDPKYQSHFEVETRATPQPPIAAPVAEAGWRVVEDALVSLIQYARWQVDEGGSHHPTLPSAINAAIDALNDVGRLVPGQPGYPQQLAGRLRLTPGSPTVAPTPTSASEDWLSRANEDVVAVDAMRVGAPAAHDVTEAQIKAARDPYVRRESISKTWWRSHGRPSVYDADRPVILAILQAANAARPARGDERGVS